MRGRGVAILAAVVCAASSAGCFRCTPGADPCATDPASCEDLPCAPGVLRCAGDTLETCDATGGAWVPAGACSPAQSCIDDGAPGGARCDPPECDPGDVGCGAGGGQQACVGGAWQAETSGGP